MAANGCYSVPKPLVSDPVLTAGQKVLITILASESTPERPADHSHQQLANKLGVARTTVARWLDELEASGYLWRESKRFPIPRDKSRTRYHLPVRVWRLFLRGWAMVGGKFRRMAKNVLHWIEQRLPLVLLIDLEEQQGRPKSPSSFHYKNSLTKRPVRGAQRELDSGGQLSLAQLMAEVPSVAARHSRMEHIASWVANPELRAKMLGQQV